MKKLLNGNSNIFEVIGWIVSIGTTAASVWSAIKCEKISKQQMNEISEMTSDKVIYKILALRNGENE